MGFYKKRNFQRAFDENLSVTHVFIKQIFRTADKAPSFPAPPHSAAQGVGYKWIFSVPSREIGYGFLIHEN
jgi:hypothetical protein